MTDAPLIEGSLKQWTMLYMMERRLTIDEALAVQKLLEADPKLAYVYEHWDQPAAKFPSYVFDSIVILLRGKVLHWMDKYNEGHRARCMFTGAS